MVYDPHMRESACPTCAKKIARSADTWPFCSKRCRAVDLGEWLGDGYRVPAEPPEDLDPEVLGRLLEDASCPRA